MKPSVSHPIRPLVFTLSLSLLPFGCGWKLETQAASEAGGANPDSALAAAPDFSLANDDGSHVSLDALLAAGKPAILVFYRGHW